MAIIGHNYLLSLPERALRSAAALVGGTSLLLTETLLPDVLRETTTYRITIGDLQKWQVQTTDLTELDVVAVAIGDRVEISIDALCGVALNGTGIAIGKTPLMERGDVTYPVTIALEDPGELPLHWGMTTVVTIHVADD